MASVYRAYEPALDRYVALKVLPREFLHDPGFAERFKREAKAIARLEHPNIVPIYAYDIDRAEGIPWMALRLVGNPDPEKQRGGALSQLLKRGLLAPRGPSRSSGASPTPSTTRTARASSTATSSRRTCCSTRTAASTSPTSASRRCSSPRGASPPPA